MEKKVCKHFQSFRICDFLIREPDGSISECYKLYCGKFGEMYTRSFNCFREENCELLKPSEEEANNQAEEKTIVYKPISDKTEAEVSFTQESFVKPMVETSAEEGGIPGGSSLDVSGHSLLRYFTLRVGNIAIRPYKPLEGESDILFEIIKWYPNQYFGKHDEFTIKKDNEDIAVNKDNPHFEISSSLLDMKECCYVLAFVYSNLGNIMGETIKHTHNLFKQLIPIEQRDFNHIKKIAKFIVRSIIEQEGKEK